MVGKAESRHVAQDSFRLEENPRKADSFAYGM